MFCVLTLESKKVYKEEIVMLKPYYVFILAAACIIPVLGWQSYSLIKNQIRIALSETLNTTLKLTEQGVESWVNENKNTVNSLANSKQIIELTKRLLDVNSNHLPLLNSPDQQVIRSIIQPFLKWNKLEGFFIISLDNISLASSRDDNIGSVNLLTTQFGIMQKLNNGETVVTLPQLSDVPLQDKENNFVELRPTMFMAAPIKDEYNKIIAFLSLRIDPSIEFSKIFDRAQLGKTGETYAFNNKGLMISNSRFDGQLRELRLIDKNQNSILNVTLKEFSPVISSLASQGEKNKFTHMAQAALQGESSSTLLPYADYRGVDVVGAWLWSETLGLGIATEQNAEEALRSISYSRYVFILFCLAILVGLSTAIIMFELSHKKLLAEIEARKYTQTELNKLSMVVEQSPSSVMISDLNGVIEYVNPRYLEVTGYTALEIMGTTTKILQASANSSVSYADVQNQLDVENRWFGEIVQKRKNGDESIELAKIGLLRDEAGIATNYIFMTEDITDRKKSEKQIEYSKLMLECVLNTVGDAIITINKEGVIIMANQATEDMWGRDIADLIGMNVRELMPEKYREAHKNGLAHYIQTGEAKVLNKKMKLEGVRANGEIFPIEAVISDTMFKEERMFTAAMSDITERQSSERTIRRMQKMDAIGEISGGLAHDFNNLLGIIIGNLDLMARKVKDDSKLRERIEVIQKAALRGSELTRRLLNFSRHSPLSTSIVNVNLVLSNIEQMIGKSLTSKIAIKTILSDDLWMVELDPSDLEDMLVNLSLNSRDAMPDGGILTFETRNTVLEDITLLKQVKAKSGKYVEIVVSDDGEGMSKAVSEHIFEPFFTTKEKNQGTGLGLSMVYGFVKRSEGQIYVYSEVGLGTTFKIYLPCAVSGSNEKPLPYEEILDIPKGTETILIVDDEKALVSVAEEILSELGYATMCAYSADEALEYLETNTTIDLLFTDIVMPGSIGGFELASIVSNRYPNIKVLLTSGFAGKRKMSKENEKWTKLILAKPYRRDQLALNIRQTLEGRG
jgi:PAS domain S-box-containing protein